MKTKNNKVNFNNKILKEMIKLCPPHTTVKKLWFFFF